MESPRNLSDALRHLCDDALASLFAARPDLTVPVPADFGALASRASSRASLARALDRLDRFCLEVLEVLAVLPEPAPLDALGRGLGDPPPDRLRSAVERLRALALMWGDDEALRLVRAVREALPEPAGLGMPIASALAAYSPTRLSGLAQDLGLPGPEAIAPALRDPAFLDALLGRCGATEREILDQLTWGPPVGLVPDALRSVRAKTANSPVRWLLAHGLLVGIDLDAVVLPREIALHLRRGRILSGCHPGPPPLEARPVVDSDRAAAAQASVAVRLVEELLRGWSVAPPPVLRAGGLGVRELRRAARELDVPERVASLLVETAHAAELVASTHELDAVWAPTPAYDEWREAAVEQRWLVLATTWLDTTRVSGLVGERDERDKPRNALGPDLDWPSAPDVRRAALEALAGVPEGEAATDVSVAESVAWHAPRRGGWLRPLLVEATLAEAELLGLTGRGALANFARLLLQGEAAVAAAALASLLPEPVDFVLLQADLTAVAPGPLAPSLAREISLAADVESKGGATVYRFTPASVRRALDAGRTAADLHALLAKHSRTPIPQPLTYLVDDVARRHGRIRVGTCSAYVRCDDPAVLDELVVAKKTASLRLRRLAPTVLAAAAAPDRVLEVLRAAGHAPVPESAEGELVVPRPEAHRAPPRSRPARRPHGVPAPTDTLLQQAVRALRAGERATTAPRTPVALAGLPGADAAITLAALRDAAAEGRAVWIGYVNAQGQASNRIIEPLRVSGGYVEALDHLHDEVRTFAVHRVTGVAELDGDEPA